MKEFHPDSARPWHRIETDHWDPQFEGLPRRVPWFDGDQPPRLRSYVRRCAVMRSSLGKVAPYAGEKGNLRFTFDRPIPYRLIARIVRSKAKQLAGLTAAKKKPRR